MIWADTFYKSIWWHILEFFPTWKYSRTAINNCSIFGKISFWRCVLYALMFWLHGMILFWMLLANRFFIPRLFDQLHTLSMKLIVACSFQVGIPFQSFGIIFILAFRISHLIQIYSLIWQKFLKISFSDDVLPIDYPPEYSPDRIPTNLMLIVLPTLWVSLTNTLEYPWVGISIIFITL